MKTEIKKTMKMDDLENTDKFKKTEKRLIKLKRKLEKRIDKTDEAMIEAKKIGEELKKLHNKKKSAAKNQ